MVSSGVFAPAIFSREAAIAVKMSRSCAAKPLTVSTRFGIRSLRRWSWFCTCPHWALIASSEPVKRLYEQPDAVAAVSTSANCTNQRRCTDLISNLLGISHQLSAIRFRFMSPAAARAAAAAPAAAESSEAPASAATTPEAAKPSAEAAAERPDAAVPAAPGAATPASAGPAPPPVRQHCDDDPDDQDHRPGAESAGC